MSRIRWAALVIVVLGIGVPVRGQELKTDGVLKKDGGGIVAALASVPGERVVVAYVARGTEGEKEKLTNWAEVRLLDVQSGKYKVLSRAATPATLPGIGANYTLLGFTADGKKVVASTTDPGGTTKKLVLDLPDFKDEPKGKGEKDKAKDPNK
jgi:hypothetical protein